MSNLLQTVFPIILFHGSSSQKLINFIKFVLNKEEKFIDKRIDEVTNIDVQFKDKILLFDLKLGQKIEEEPPELFIFSYNVLDYKSFTDIEKLISREIEYLHSKIPFIIVGTKEKSSDLHDFEETKVIDLKDKFGGSYINIICFDDKESLEILINNITLSIGQPRKRSNSKNLIETKIQKKFDVPKDYFGYNLNFYSIFDIQEMKNSFVSFLHSENNIEPLEFLLDVKKFSKIIDNNRKKKDFKMIVETYIMKGSKKEINISGKISKEILKLYTDDVTYNLDDVFIKAESEILSDLKNDTWSRFIYSDNGYNTIASCSHFSNVISKDPILILISKFQGSFYHEKLDQEVIIEYSKILSNSKSLLSFYLSPKWKDTMKLNEDIQKKFHDLNQDIREMRDNNQKELTIKILILENHIQKVSSFLNPIISTFLPSLDDQFYSAIMVGPFLLEWNQSEICVPRKCISKAAVFCSDLDEKFPIEKFEKILPDLAQLIVRYNIQHRYSKKGSNDEKGKFKNSQDFVEEVLTLIGVEKEKISYPLKSLLQNIKTNGSTQLSFKPSNVFKNRFKFEESNITFTSHEELDLFVKNLTTQEPKFQYEFENEYKFLKSLDRAFWMKYHSIIEECTSESKLRERIKNVQPYIKQSFDEEIEENEYIEDCPFKDPIVTQSFMKGDIKAGFTFFKKPNQFKKQELKSNAFVLKVSGSKAPKVTLPRDYFGYHIEFNAIFTEENFQHEFEKYLKKIEYHTEPFEFMMDLKTFQSLQDVNELKTSFRKIFETYLISRAPKKVPAQLENINPLLEIYKNDSNVEMNIFDEIEKDVLHDLKGSFQSFIKHDMGYKFLSENTYNRHIIHKKDITNFFKGNQIKSN